MEKGRKNWMDLGHVYLEKEVGKEEVKQSSAGTNKWKKRSF